MLNMLAVQLASSGGPVLVVLFLISVASIALAIFKAVQFARMGVGRTAGTDDAMARWSQGQFADALAAARADRSPLSTAVAATMASLIGEPANRDRAREIAGHVALQQLNILGRNLRFLETVAQAAPMLGLLGTVIGMISAFGELSAKGGAIDPSALAGGIWVALITTAAGLTVAIPVYFLSMWFESRVDNERSSMEVAIARVLLSVQSVDSTPEPAPKPPIRMPAATFQPLTTG